MVTSSAHACSLPTSHSTCGTACAPCDIEVHVYAQLAKLVEEGEAKKERHEEFQHFQEESHELQAQVQALEDELADARSLSASLQHEAQSAR